MPNRLESLSKEVLRVHCIRQVRTLEMLVLPSNSRAFRDGNAQMSGPDLSENGSHRWRVFFIHLS